MFELTRRDVLSLFPSTGLFAIAKPYLNFDSPTYPNFSNISSHFISGDNYRINTLGYFIPGDRGHATYVCDNLATPSLAQMTPRFCSVGSDGRYWRAALNDDGLVPVAAGGGVGNPSGSSLGASSQSSNSDFGDSGIISPIPYQLANDQPIIAQALQYNFLIGAKGLQFNDGHFSIWCPQRTADDDNINLDKSGIPFVINRPTIWQAGPNATMFVRRKFDGSDPAVFDGTQYLPMNWVRNGQGIYWRGGMFMLAGTVGPRPDHSHLPSIHLKGNWTINGGIPQSPNRPGLITNGTSWYELNADGSGWDVTDRPIWPENDRNTGNIIFDGNIHIGGFRGELLTQPGNTHGSIYQVGKLVMRDTDGDGFNPCPSYSNNTPLGLGTVQMESLKIKNAFQALEGATGWDSYILNLEIDNCVGGGGLMSGVWGVGPPDPDKELGILQIGNISLSSSNGFNALRGNHIEQLSAVDTTLNIGQFNLITTGVEISNATITVDQANLDDGVVFCAASTPGARSTYSNLLNSVVFNQTPAAQVAGYTVLDPIDWLGSFGEGNVINEVSGIAWTAPFCRDKNSICDGSPSIMQNYMTYIT